MDNTQRLKIDKSLQRFLAIKQIDSEAWLEHELRPTTIDLIIGTSPRLTAETTLFKYALGRNEVKTPIMLNCSLSLGAVFSKQTRFGRVKKYCFLDDSNTIIIQKQQAK